METVSGQKEIQFKNINISIFSSTYFSINQIMRGFFYFLTKITLDLSFSKVLVSVTVKTAILTFIILQEQLTMGILSILFFVTATLYSSVGFGGGSTYLALLLIWGLPYTIFPIIALSCNIIVVSGNCFNYIRAGNLNLKLLIPYLIGSIPLAFIGGSLPVEKDF